VRLALALALAAPSAGCAPPPPPGSHPRPMTPFEGRNRSAAGATLRQLLTLQRTYRAMHDAWAVSVGDLREVGWEDGMREQMYARIVRVGDGGACMAMLPRVRSLPAWSMADDGVLHRGAFCGRPW
jgi:hypothetical protein